MMLSNLTSGRVGRLLILLTLVLTNLTAVIAFTTLPAGANNAPIIETSAYLAQVDNRPLINVYQGDTINYQLELFPNEPATGIVMTATIPTGIHYQNSTCGGTEVEAGVFVWPLGRLDALEFAFCSLTLTVSPTTTGMLTLTTEATADAYDPVNSQLTVVNQLEVLAPTSLVIGHTAAASPTLPFTYTVSAPPHAHYATRAYTAGGSGQGQLRSPAATATDAQGNLYVVDGGNYRLQKFDSAGNFLLEWGTIGTNEGQFDGVNDIALDSAGNVWVADQNNNRLQKFDAQGNFLQAVGTFGSGDGEFEWPWGLAIAPDDTIYVADYLNNRVQYLDGTGAYLGQWDGTAGGGTSLSGPYRVAIAPDGSVYVSDLNGVQKFTATGTFIAQVGTAGTAVGQLNEPIGLAVDEAGNLYVTDSNLGRVQKFADTGDFLTGWGRVGDRLGLLGSEVRGLESLEDGRLLAADTSNNQLVWFSSATAFALSHTGQIAYRMSPTGTYTFTAATVAGLSSRWQCDTTDTAEMPLINGAVLIVALDEGEQVNCTAVYEPITPVEDGLIYLPVVIRP